MDKLVVSGITPGRANVLHAAAVTLLDARKFCSRTAYMQCVLACEQFSGRGMVNFPPTTSQTWYRLLLRSRAPSPQDLPAAQAMQMLKHRMSDEAAALREPDHDTVEADILELDDAPAPADGDEVGGAAPPPPGHRRGPRRRSGD